MEINENQNNQTAQKTKPINQVTDQELTELLRTTRNRDAAISSLREVNFRKDKRLEELPSNPFSNFSLGLRVGELVALKWKDLKDHYPHIRRMEQRQYEQSLDETWHSHLEVVEHTKNSSICPRCLGTPRMPA